MNRSPHFEDLDENALNSLLRKFFGAVRNKRGEPYSKSGMVNIRSGINRHLTLPPHSRKINLMRGEDFQSANKVFCGKLRENKKAGRDVTKHHEPIPPNEIDKIYESYFLPYMDQSPEVLQHKVFFDITYYFGNRGREGLRELKRNSFIFEQAPDGREYAKLSFNPATKCNQGSESSVSAMQNADKQNNMFEQPGNPRCPVKSLKKYISMLNENNEAFFQKPNPRFRIPNKKILVC